MLMRSRIPRARKNSLASKTSRGTSEPERQANPETTVNASAIPTASIPSPNVHCAMPQTKPNAMGPKSARLGTC